MPARAALLLLLSLAFPLAACAPDAANEARAAGDGFTAVERGPAGGGAERDSEAAGRVRAALEEGRLGDARALLEELPRSAGVARALLAARLALREGNGVGALRSVEEARAAAEGDAVAEARVAATAAEVYVGLGKLASAAREIERAERRGGTGAELERARGVLHLATPGEIVEGLGALERARSLDPDLPFLAAELRRAYVLRGREALARPDPLAALRHARSARAIAADDPDAIQLEADARGALLDVDGQIELLGELAALGHDVADEIARAHHRAATKRLVEGDRPGAVEHYLAARASGMDDDALGFGTTVLADERERLLEEGVELYDAADLAAARAAFERALALDPGSLVSRNHLAVVLFRAEEYGRAAELWEECLASGVGFPEPVHLNLARARVLAGERERAREVLESYLEREPDGVWVPETKVALAKLDR